MIFLGHTPFLDATRGPTTPLLCTRSGVTTLYPCEKCGSRPVTLYTKFSKCNARKVFLIPSRYLNLSSEFLFLIISRFVSYNCNHETRSRKICELDLFLFSRKLIEFGLCVFFFIRIWYD